MKKKSSAKKSGTLSLAFVWKVGHHHWVNRRITVPILKS